MCLHYCRSSSEVLGVWRECLQGSQCTPLHTVSSEHPCSLSQGVSRELTGYAKGIPKNPKTSKMSQINRILKVPISHHGIQNSRWIDQMQFCLNSFRCISNRTCCAWTCILHLNRFEAQNSSLSPVVLLLETYYPEYLHLYSLRSKLTHTTSHTFFLEYHTVHTTLSHVLCSSNSKSPLCATG